MEKVADARLGQSIDGRYRLDSQLGAGGMGVVYKGEQVGKGKGKPIAVKFLHDSFAGQPDLVKRFDREVSVLRRLKHAHVVGIIGAGKVSGVPYLVMDFLSGKSLGKVLDRGALSPARAVHIARQVLAGVGHAHKSGVVHRDLKPDNILLVDEDGGDFVKILDFGLAKMVQSEEGTQLTHTGFVLGTPGYMAPEQAGGLATDERTDIYAVGVILYQMVVGRKPFVAESPMAVLRMHMDDAPMRPREMAPDCRITAPLEEAILRALEKAPEKRWPDAAAFAAALEATPEAGMSRLAVDDEEDISLELSAAGTHTAVGKRSARKSAAPTRAQPRRRRRRFGWPVQVAVLALLAGGAAFGWTMLGRQKQERVRQTVDGALGTGKGVLQSMTSAETPHPKAPVSGKPPAPTAAPPSASDDDEPDAPAPPRDTPGMRLEQRSSPQPARKAVRLADATRLLKIGKVDDAIDALYQLRRASPKSPDVALLLGHAYFRKLWRTDGLREYDAALAARVSLRADRQLQHNAITALDDPTSKPARALIKTRLGAAALPELRRAAHDKNALVAKRASTLAGQLTPKRR